jgi:hypothetical protein
MLALYAPRLVVQLKLLLRPSPRLVNPFPLLHCYVLTLLQPDLVLDARCESNECYKARSLTRDLANIVALSARDASPEAYLESLGLRDEEKLRRDAEEHEKRSPWCNNAGTVCTKQKREAWCNNAGTVCTKKRDAGCGDVGGPCYKLKRAAEAVASAISAPSPWCNNAGTVCTREAWCNNAGTVCTKEKREAEALAKAWCNNAGTVCTKSKRDAHAMANAVNDILAQI